MPATKPTSATGNPFIDGLLFDTQWATGAFTVSFPTDGSFYGPNYYSYYTEAGIGFRSATGALQSAVREVLADYAGIANLSFTQIAETGSSHADLRFGMNTDIENAHAYFPGGNREAGDVWFGTKDGAYANPVPGDYAWMTVIHEIGHALGLKHPHEGYAMPAERDSVEYTVMSYRSHVGGPVGASYTNEDPGGYPSTLMMEDIAALQHMYGANFATRAGDTHYSWSPATGELLIDGIGQGRPAVNRILSTVWDGGGTDTYDFSAYANALSIDLRPGGWTQTGNGQLARMNADGRLAVGNIANAHLHDGNAASLIENARGGSADDSLTGNQADNVLEGGAGGDRLDGGAGLDIASYAHAATGIVASLADAGMNTGDAFRDLFVAMEGLEGSVHGDRLFGDGANNVLLGQGGNDVLTGGGGDDLLDGGAGRDDVLYSGFRTQYAVAQTGGRQTVGSTFEGTDTLAGVEQLVFRDGRLVFDVNDGAAAVYRMYDSMFARAPDVTGFNYWIDVLGHGGSVQGMAQSFADSREFRETYGALTNGAFVEQLYRNVLDRQGDAGGIAYWTGQLDAAATTRGTVLAGFSESAEHVEMLREPVSKGLWDIDEAVAQMARFYSAAFDRRPDAGGLAFWSDSVKTGAATPAGVADLFAASAEFLTRYGQLSNEQFVGQLYRNILDRAGDAGGVAYWTNAIATAAADRGDVLAGFADSAENMARTHFDMEHGILLA